MAQGFSFNVVRVQGVEFSIEFRFGSSGWLRMAKRFQRPQTPRHSLSVKKKFPESSLMFGDVSQGASVSGGGGQCRPQCATILAIATPKEEAHHCWKPCAL